jgi:bifunctional non-homologous end joining protein LigD
LIFRLEPRVAEIIATQQEISLGRKHVLLTRLDQRWWPDLGITKADVVDYYRRVAAVALPHLAGRPFTIKRHYNGPRSPFAWSKDAPAELPSWIPVSEQPAKSRGGALVRYPLVNDEAALLWMVEYGCIDLHVWTSRIDRPDRADVVLFDLDPAGVPFVDVARTALLLREALAALDLDSYPMTTGGDGLHVRVPVARAPYDEVRRLARVVATALMRTTDGLVTLERSLDRRHGVFVDTKMNGHGQQIVAPYSLRPNAAAAVATPLRWSEVDERLDPSAFGMREVITRVARDGDLAEPLLHGRRRVGTALARLGRT